MRKREEGFSYVIALFLVAVLAIVALRGIEHVATNEQREKEAQLLEAGQAYRDAIGSYYNGSSGTNKTFPPTVDALLEDPRTSTLFRHLRRRYLDPMTARPFAEVRNADDKLIGVVSTSKRQAIKVAGFTQGLAGLNGKTTYQQWQFVFQPETGGAPKGNGK